MAEAATLDETALRGWIDRTDVAEDIVTARLVQAFRATLDEDAALPVHGEPAPPGLHWCLAPAVVRQSSLGEDGHPARGGFLPPVPLPRRMWAGGRVEVVTRSGSVIRWNGGLASSTLRSSMAAVARCVSWRLTTSILPPVDRRSGSATTSFTGRRSTHPRPVPPCFRSRDHQPRGAGRCEPARCSCFVIRR